MTRANRRRRYRRRKHWRRLFATTWRGRLTVSARVWLADKRMREDFERHRKMFGWSGEMSP